MLKYNFHYCDAPRSLGIYFQDSDSFQMEALQELHDNIMFYLVIILFGLVWRLIWLFTINSDKLYLSNKYNNYEILIESITIIIPVFVLLYLSFPSFKLLYLMDKTNDVSVYVMEESHPWYWIYQYPGDFSEIQNIASEMRIADLLNPTPDSNTGIGPAGDSIRDTVNQNIPNVDIGFGINDFIPGKRKYFCYDVNDKSLTTLRSKFNWDHARYRYYYDMDHMKEYNCPKRYIGTDVKRFEISRVTIQEGDNIINTIQFRISQQLKDKLGVEFNVRCQGMIGKVVEKEGSTYLSFPEPTFNRIYPVKMLDTNVMFEARRLGFKISDNRFMNGDFQRVIDHNCK